MADVPPQAWGTRRLRPLPVAAALVVAALLPGCGVLPSPAPDDFAEPSTAAPATPSEAPSAGATSATEVASPVTDLATAERAAVRVRNVRCAGLSVGSGFAVDDTTLVTNRHVIDGTRELQLETFDGRNIEVTTSSVATVADLAVVRTEEPLPQALTLAAADPTEGQPVTVVGYPGGGERTLTRGVVQGYTEDPLGGSTQVFVSGAVAIAGSSGSPVLDAAGAVVGVVYAAEQGTNRSVAVPVSVLRTLLATPAGFAPLTECTG